VSKRVGTQQVELGRSLAPISQVEVAGLRLKDVLNLPSAFNRSSNEVLPEFVLTVQVVDVAEAELQEKRDKGSIELPFAYVIKKVFDDGAEHRTPSACGP